MYQINNQDFKILSKYKIYLNNLDNILENVPRKDLYFKDLIRDKSYETLSYIIKVSYEDSKDNYIKYRNIIKTNIAMLDFLLDRMLDKKYISEKSAEKITLSLVEINKMANSLINNIIKNAS